MLRDNGAWQAQTNVLDLHLKNIEDDPRSLLFGPKTDRDYFDLSLSRLHIRSLQVVQ